MSDKRLERLRAADLKEVHDAQVRYQLVSDTLNDTVSKLAKIMGAGEESLRGEWVQGLKDDAEGLKDRLDKAAVRYNDVANEIKIYEPALETAIDEVNSAERAESEGNASLSKANSMPDPQKDAEGNISPEEQQKATDKQRAQDDANGAVTAAKNKLQGALDALESAGRRLGDAVNEKNYKDGLTDKIGWGVMSFFTKFTEVFGWIVLALSALAILVPGVGTAILAAVAGAVMLIADSVLLGGGDGSVLSVVLGAVGLGFVGAGALAGIFSNMAKNLAGLIKTIGKIKFNPFWKPGSGAQIFELGALGKPLAIGTGRPGWQNFFGNGFNKWFGGGFGGMMKTWWNGIAGAEVFKNLSFLKGLPFFDGAMAGLGKGFQFAWAGWGSLNQGFAVAAGIIIASLQLTEHPSVKDS